MPKKVKDNIKIVLNGPPQDLQRIYETSPRFKRPPDKLNEEPANSTETALPK